MLMGTCFSTMAFITEVCYVPLPSSITMGNETSHNLLVELFSIMGNRFGPTPEKEALVSKADEDEVPRGSVVVTQIGIWTIYQYIADWRDSLPGWHIFVNLGILASCLPAVQRFSHDLWRLGGPLVALYTAASFANALLPSISLYYSALFMDAVRLKLVRLTSFEVLSCAYPLHKQTKNISKNIK